MVGSMRTFVTDGRTDRLTDRRAWIHRTRGRVQKSPIWNEDFLCFVVISLWKRWLWRSVLLRQQWRYFMKSTHLHTAIKQHLSRFGSCGAHYRTRLTRVKIYIQIRGERGDHHFNIYYYLSYEGSGTFYRIEKSSCVEHWCTTHDFKDLHRKIGYFQEEILL